jgi:DNA-binding transcriptional LysR family regulator
VAITVSTRRASARAQEARADVVISHSRPKGQPTARSAATFEIGLYAHKDYVARAGLPATVGDLGRHAFVAPEAERARAWLETVLGLPSGLTRSGFRTDSHVAQVAAIEAGVGVGVCYAGLADSRADLVRVLPEVVGILECWVWSPRPKLGGGHAGQVFEYLVESLSGKASPVGRIKAAPLARASLNSIAA